MVHTRCSGRPATATAPPPAGRRVPPAVEEQHDIAAAALAVGAAVFEVQAPR